MLRKTLCAFRNGGAEFEELLDHWKTPVRPPSSADVDSVKVAQLTAITARGNDARRRGEGMT